MTWMMPPEWTPHKRTWMGWPCNRDVLEMVGSPDAAYTAWSGVANTIARFEPVTMVCNPGEEATARKYLNAGVTIAERELGDSWMRDCGPTFVVNEQGALGAVDWTFNGWGGRTFPDASADALVARFVAEQAGAERLPSVLVNEGGGIHVDGEGTLLLTETVQMNRNRNPNWTAKKSKLKCMASSAPARRSGCRAALRPTPRSPEPMATLIRWPASSNLAWW